MANKYITTILNKDKKGSAFFSASDIITMPAKSLYTSSGLDTVITKKNIIKWGSILLVGSIGLSVLIQTLSRFKNVE